MTRPLNRPIRVGFVVHVMQVAGAEVLVRETIHRLGSQIIPTVFCLDKVGSIGEDLQGEGVDVVCYHRKPGRDWSVSRRMAKDFSARKIDVLHAHQYTPFFYSALAKPFSRPRPKLILTEHGRHYPDVVSAHRRAFNRLILDRFADAVNACCQFSAKALCNVDGFAGGRMEVIENGIQTERYQPATDRAQCRQDIGLNPARRYLIHVARHHPVKDQSTLIKGFAQAAAKVPDVDLLLVGDGPLRLDLEDLVRQLGIKDRVVFMGIRRDVPEVLRAADFFALTSVSEAASLTLLEAMATALPVIVTNVGGNPEIVRTGVDGLLFPRGNADECANAIVQLATNPTMALQMGANGRARVLGKYRLEQTVNAYFDLYRRVTGL